MWRKRKERKERKFRNHDNYKRYDDGYSRVQEVDDFSMWEYELWYNGVLEWPIEDF